MMETKMNQRIHYYIYNFNIKYLIIQFLLRFILIFDSFLLVQILILF